MSLLHLPPHLRATAAAFQGAQRRSRLGQLLERANPRPGEALVQVKLADLWKGGALDGWDTSDTTAAPPDAALRAILEAAWELYDEDPEETASLIHLLLGFQQDGHDLPDEVLRQLIQETSHGPLPPSRRRPNQIWHWSSEVVATARNLKDDDVLAAWEALRTEDRLSSAFGGPPPMQKRRTFLLSASRADEVFERAVREHPTDDAVRAALVARAHLFGRPGVRDAVLAAMRDSGRPDELHLLCLAAPPEEFRDFFQRLWQAEGAADYRERVRLTGGPPGAVLTIGVLTNARPELLRTLTEADLAELLASDEAELRLAALRVVAVVRQG
jgi:hypothetical protein